jgi:hypothetical protein
VEDPIATGHPVPDEGVDHRTARDSRLVFALPAGTPYALKAILDLAARSLELDDRAVPGRKPIASGEPGADVTALEVVDSLIFSPGFLRLVVARHQPDSINGAVSTPLALDPVRLGVVRQTTAVRDTDAVKVTLSGADGLGNAVQVSVQQADTTIADDDLRWRPVSDPEPLAATAGEGQTTWSGKIALPKTTDPLRLVIEELEPGRRDEGGAVVDVQTVVFVETVELPPA